MIMTEQEDKRPEILKDLWTGESIWCKNCKHHVNCHNTGQTPLCNYKTAGISGDCECTEFVS